MTALLLAWQSGERMDWLPPDQQGKFHTFKEFWPIFIPSLTGMIGFWATLSLNMPDFTRFGHSQREQAIGQIVALPTTMTVFAAMGVIITSAAVVIYPNMKRMNCGSRETRRPVSPGRCDSDFDVHGGRCYVSCDIAANVVSPANDLPMRFPSGSHFGRAD